MDIDAQPNQELELGWSRFQTGASHLLDIVMRSEKYRIDFKVGGRAKRVNNFVLVW